MKRFFGLNYFIYLGVALNTLGGCQTVPMTSMTPPAHPFTGGTESFGSGGEVKTSSRLGNRPLSYDRLRSFEELLGEGTPGKDYTVILEARDSPFMIQAIHGGYTEIGTSELLSSISAGKMATYDFHSLKKSSEYDEKFLTDPKYHLTAARFDDPVLKSESMKHDLCLSLHGFGGEEADLCVGGGNLDLRGRTVDTLAKSMKEYKTCNGCCGPYAGTSTKNPVNFCEQKGLQLEMSPRFRKRMVEDEAFREKVARILREALREGLTR